MKRWCLVIVLIIFISGVSAQEYTFKVLVNKGQNVVKVDNNWQLIKVGSSLQTIDQLKIPRNAYLGLVHVSGKPLEVKEEGQYKVVDLAAKVSGGSGVLNKYTDFILSSTYEKKGNFTATGAATRGTDEIKVFLPKPQFAIVFNDQISISWAKVPKTQSYLVRFKSMFGDELDKLEVSDTTVSINLTGPKLINEDNILLEVSSMTDHNKASEAFILKKLSPADKARIKNSLSKIASQTTEQTALNNLFLASFFEDNALLIDASSAYQEAIKLAPDVPYFQEAFNEFLTRNGL